MTIFLSPVAGRARAPDSPGRPTAACEAYGLPWRRRKVRPESATSDSSRSRADAGSGVSSGPGGVEVGTAGGATAVWAGLGLRAGFDPGPGVLPGLVTGSVSEAGGVGLGPSAVVPSSGAGDGGRADGPGGDGAAGSDADGPPGGTVGRGVADRAAPPASDGLPAAPCGAGPGAPASGAGQVPNPTRIVAATRATFSRPRARTRWTRSIEDTATTLSSVGHSRLASHSPRRSC